MKHMLLILVLLFLNNALKSQSPEPVYGFARICQSLDWYKTQNKLWKAETVKDPKNAKAWYYYYRSDRNLLKLDTTDKRPKADRKKAHEALIEAMGKAVPESYEYALVEYSNCGLDEKKLPILRKLETMGTNRYEHLEFSMIQAERERNFEKRKTAALQKMKALDYSPGFMYYCYNMIIGLKPNAIIFTVGDNDTYGVWMLQAMGIRTDVTAINFYLLGLEDYKKIICNEFKIEEWAAPLFPKNISDDSIHTLTQNANTKMIRSIINNGKNVPVYFSLTADEYYTGPFSKNLYLTGMSYEYSEEDLDNTAILQQNFENNFKLDYILNHFYDDMSQEIVDRVNANYIVPMFSLWKHYTLAGETTKANNLKPYLLHLLKNRPEDEAILKEIQKN